VAHGANVVLGDAGGFGTGTVNVSAAATLFTSSQINGSAVVMTNAVTLNNNLTLRGDRGLTLAGLITQSAAARTITTNMNVDAPLTISGGINLTNQILTVTQSTYGEEVRISSVISDSGTLTGIGGLTKAGVGILTLTDSNTYNGTTSVNAGILRITNGNALGSSVGSVVVTGNTTGGSASAALSWTGPPGPSTWPTRFFV